MDNIATRPNYYPSALLDGMKEHLGDRASLRAGKDDLLAQVTYLADIQKSVNHELPKTITKLRDNGASWQEIGAALGVTKQAAQQRYGTA